MLVVPLKGDKIETLDGLTLTVLSFTNYRDKGPAVYVEHEPGSSSDAVYFFDIVKIDDKAVEYSTGSKVFKTVGEISRRYQLPQVGDTITYRDKHGTGDMTVTGLQLHKRDELSKGLLVVGVSDDSDEKVYIVLDQIIDLVRDIGNDFFNRGKFLSYYADYKGTTQ